MTPPYVLADRLEVTMFASLSDLTMSTEAQDVRDGVYEAYDAAGRRVQLAAESDDSEVTAEAAEPAPERLHTLLIAHVLAVGPVRVGIDPSRPRRGTVVVSG